MKNTIRSKGKIWKRRSKNLTSGEIQCPLCGKWTKVPKLTDKHFNEEYLCRVCKKQFTEHVLGNKKAPKAKSKPKKFVASFPDDCPHKPFFGCKTPKGCVGCYWNPDKKIALMGEEKKTAKVHWFYGDKGHSKKVLKVLEDIKSGKGLGKGGTRTYLRYARKQKDDEDE